jgi:hypothetical protein
MCNIRRLSRRYFSSEAIVSVLLCSWQNGYPTQPVKTRDPFKLDPDTTRLC